MSSPCVLLIDNDIKLLVKMESALKRAGFRVLTAHDGRQAIYLALATVPDVILCDGAWSSRNGLDVRRVLAQDTHTASIPIFSFPKPLAEPQLSALVHALVLSQSVR